MEENKVIIKKSIGKSFRLIDFNIYDETKNQGSDTDSYDSDGKQKQGKPEESEFVIQMYGINEKGETASIYINDFKPFFYIKVGDNWTQREVNMLLADIKKQLSKYYHNSILSIELVDKHKLYGFTAGKKYKFVKLSFDNLSAMNKVKNLWYEYNEETGRRGMKSYIFPPGKTGVNMEIYESSIPPLLRYFHINNISPSGWVFIPTNRVITPTNKTTTCKYEYICRSSQVKPMIEKENRVPYKICSFDIEASSSHGDFPVPKKTYKRLASNIIDIFEKQNIADSDRGNILIEKIIKTAFGYSKFEDVDQVFPKIMPSKQKVDSLIKILINKPFEVAKNMGDEDNIKEELLTIDNIFQALKDDVENINSDNESDAGSDAGGDREKEVSYKKNNFNTKKNKFIPKDNKLVDLIIGSSYTRDEKVQKTNEALTMLFPVLEGDKITFIGSTFMRYGEVEPYMNHCLVLGGCNEVEGAIIESVPTERDLLLQWTELIEKENPDIIIGYNIFGFDYEFMFRRSEENHCEREFLKFSRKIGELCANENKKQGISDGTLSIENTKVVLASGEYDLRYPSMPGRLQIDMYTYFRRDFNLSSYKLDDVASQFISDDVNKIICTNHEKYGDITELYSKNLTGLHKDDFIHIEITSFTSDYYKDGHKFKVLDIIHNKEITEIVKGVEKKNKYNVIIISGHHNIDGTKHVKWGMAKDDVTPQDIFKLGNGSNSDRAIVAKYCIQDCNLVHHLMNKIDVITGYVEMSRICSVPISFLVFRGQGIKLTSYVAKKCMLKDTLMPDLEKSGANDGYEGAIVLPPKCSMYMDNPVACVDYSSLYPSSMISQNYSHDSKVWTKEYDLDGELILETGEKDQNNKYIYDNLQGYQYIDIEFDTYKYVRKTPTSAAEKIKSGKKICRWAQFPGGDKGIMPSILEELLKARSDTRKLAKTEKDPFMQNILDKRQLGYKVTANSLYGQCGAKTSTFYEKDVAASTTATGRMMITYAKKIIENVYGNRLYDTQSHGPVLTKAEYVYGDSVANYTPVYIRYNNKINIITIEQLAKQYGNDNWIMCKEEGKQEKEFCELNGVESWTEKGWTPLYRVIRHKLADHKKMIRILTKTGMVDVTDDHSLILNTGKEISPKEVKIGTELLHHKLPIIENNINLITEDEAKIKGFFIGKTINNNNESISEECVIIQNEIINSSIEIRKAFLEGLYHAIGDKDKNNNKIFNISNQLIASYIYWLISSVEQKASISVSDKDINIYRIIINDSVENSNNNYSIIKMNNISYEGYVYDLTTNNHHFAAGIGNMIVHNTDSVFFTFNLCDPSGEPIRGKKALEITIEIAQDAANLCTQWLKPPMALAYEKTLMPFILLSKKRYVGMLYEEDPNKGKMKYMGLSLKRRDSCDYLKDTYGGILTILMKEQNIEKALDYLDNALSALIDGKVSMDKLAITKALRGYYKNPAQIAHRVLAERIGQRDPGNKPKAGDRMKFVYFVNSNPKALQGEKIETPEFIIENKLKIDYTFYITNQLMKPLQQLFGLALEKIWEYQGKTGALKTYKKDVQKLEEEFYDLEIFMKKREKYCSSKVKALLFDKHLTKIFNEKHGIKQITGFFTRK
jgi:DNA polymerase elongation subunit (family B)